MRSILLMLSTVALVCSSAAMAAAPASPAGTTSAPASNTTRAANGASTISVAPATTVSPEPRQVLIGRTVVQVMQAHHYPAEKLNDEFAHALLKQYFDALDPGRFYFTQTEIDDLSQKYADHLKKELEHGNLKTPFAIYKLYVTQAHKQLHYALHLLEEKQNFDSDQTFHFSRRH